MRGLDKMIIKHALTFRTLKGLMSVMSSTIYNHNRVSTYHIAEHSSMYLFLLTALAREVMQSPTSISIVTSTPSDLDLLHMHGS